MSAQPLVAPASAPTTIRRWTRLSGGFTTGFALLVVALIFVPVALGANTVQDLTTLLTYVLMAVMWNALAGYGGLVSIGQQAYIGLGAYATVWLAQHSVNPYFGMLLATAFCGVVAIPLSFLMLRFRGPQFAIGTWVVAEALAIWVSLDNALGAGTGTSLSQLDSYAPTSREHYTYWLTLAFAAFFIGALFMLLRSRLGSSLQAIRDDEDAAASVGVRVVAGKRARVRGGLAFPFRGGRRRRRRRRGDDARQHAVHRADLDLQRQLHGVHDLHGAGRWARHL